MKFLCVRCDAAMRLEQVERPEGGSLSVVFVCAACGNRVAMLTNPWETQLVRALDVRIGETASPVGPMAFVRSMLAPGREAGSDAPSHTAAASGAAPASGCPFSAMVNLAAERAGAPALGQPGAPECPVAESPDRQIFWAPEAERRLERVPEFIRPMVRQGVEHFAATRGYARITEAVMDDARGALGM